MTHSAIYDGDNTHVIELVDLKDHLDAVQTDATVQMTALVEQATGTTVTGVTLPVAMTHISAGLYRATLPYNMAISANKRYLATVKAVGSQGFRAEWVETLVAQVRRA